MACFASRTKVEWDVEPEKLLSHAASIAEKTEQQFAAEGIAEAPKLPLFRQRKPVISAPKKLPDEAARLLLRDSISPLPLHRTLTLLNIMDRFADERFSQHERLALAKAVVLEISNLEFGPEVGVGPPKSDAPAVHTWLEGIRDMTEDLRHLRSLPKVSTMVYRADSRGVAGVLEAESIDAVITSPPYPNEKDYTRTTRLESVLLGFVQNKQQLRALKRDLVRSNTRGVYKGDEDHLFSSSYERVQRIARAIERRRKELGKTSGFERLYARVTQLYFGGMARHLGELRLVLKPGALLAYVVGDQASYLRVMIRTGEILAEIANSLGYEVLGNHLFRTRLATATREQLREEIVILRWPRKRN